MTWRNTVQCGPGVHQWVMDTIELGPRVAMRWACGRVGVVSDLATPQRLRAMDPNPSPHYPQTRVLTLFAEAT